MERWILTRFGSCDIGLDAETARLRGRMDFNDCVHVLLSEGYAVANEREVTSLEEGQDVERIIYGAERRCQGHDVS